MFYFPEILGITIRALALFQILDLEVCYAFE